MKVQVVLKDETVREVLVRYSRFIEGLFTTKRVLDIQKIKPEDIAYASAPFKVFEADWTVSGIDEDNAYFILPNLMGSVPYGVRAWNYT